jgi:hypothetical protein
LVPRRWIRVLTTIVGLLSIGSCVVIDGGPGPIPPDPVEVEVNLVPRASETYEFDVEAETYGTSESVILRMSPEPGSLRFDDVAVKQSWTREGVTAEVWPEYIDVGQDQQMLATLSLTLTNESQTRFEVKLTVIIEAGHNLPIPSEEELRVEIHQQ